MRIPFIHTVTEQGETLTVAAAGQHYSVPSDHPRFAELVELVGIDYGVISFPAAEEKIAALINVGTAAVESMRSLSDRVGFHAGALYFDGDPVDGALADHIVAKLGQDDDNWRAPVAFLENLMDNPAKHVRKRLWRWISDRGLTLTPEGLVIGYKGVQGDEANSSITKGDNTVWVDGTPHTGHVPNPIGATVTMARSQVDNDRDAGCSQGLHVGTFDYAQDFTSCAHVLVVEFNPRDVVAIPKEADYAKIRVCRYRVLETTEVKINKTTWSPFEDENKDESEATLCAECGDETEDGEPTCDDCLAREDDESDDAEF